MRASSKNSVSVGDSASAVPVVWSMPGSICTHLSSDVDSLTSCLCNIERSTSGVRSSRSTDATDQLVDVDVVFDDPASKEFLLVDRKPLCEAWACRMPSEIYSVGR